MASDSQSDKQSSSTPRTDAEIMYPGSGIAMVRPEFARQLERELAEAKAAVNVAMHNHAEAENRAPRPPNVTTTREQVQDTLDKANDIDIALERGTTVSDDQLSIQRNLIQDLCLLALAPPHRHLKRELAEAQRYDKRVCDALGMKTVDPEEALNVIDGLRERLRAAERDAARYRWLREANSIMPGKPRVQPIEWYCGTAVDNAIDAAMKEGK